MDIGNRPIFQKSVPVPSGQRRLITDDEPIEDDWTEAEVLEAGKRIIERLGLEGELSDE